jgi:hypothetical protein
MEFTEEQKYKLLKLADCISKFLTDRDIKPACPTVDAEHILVEKEQQLTFYVNQHNLGWYVDKNFRKVYGDTLLIDGKVIETSLRNIKLNLIGL